VEHGIGVIMNPALQFKTPEALLSDPDLTDREKIDVLQRWEYDELELAVAVYEGMCGEEPLLLGRISCALNTLVKRLDVRRDPPIERSGAPGR
jgi:hypothetical protein